MKRFHILIKQVALKCLTTDFIATNTLQEEMRLFSASESNYFDGFCVHNIICLTVSASSKKYFNARFSNFSYLLSTFNGPLLFNSICRTRGSDRCSQVKTRHRGRSGIAVEVHLRVDQKIHRLIQEMALQYEASDVLFINPP